MRSFRVKPSGSLGSAVRSLVKRLARRFGFEVARISSEWSLETRRARILERHEIDLVFDVGANVGQYGHGLRHAGYEGRIVSFEPLAGPFAALERDVADDGGWECVRVALGGEDGTSRMFVAGNSYSSSLLPMDAAHVVAAPESVTVGTEEVTTARLDSLAPELFADPMGLLLKLDVQGYELEVLRGATSTLARAMVVEVELSLISLYEGQPLYREMIEFLDRAGFDLAVLEPAFSDPQSGHVLQFEAIFVRRAG